MNRPEEALQRACVQWLRLNERRLRDRLIWFAVPNQRGTRTRAEAGVLKAMGVQPGIADLVLTADLGRTVYVELKAPGRESGLSPAQREFLERSTRLRTPYYVVSSPEAFIEIVEQLIRA